MIEADGVFLGAAVSLPDAQGWRFVAANDRVGNLHGTIVPTLMDARRLARQAFLATGGVACLVPAA